MRILGLHDQLVGDLQHSRGDTFLARLDRPTMRHCIEVGLMMGVTAIWSGFDDETVFGQAFRGAVHDGKWDPRVRELTMAPRILTDEERAFVRLQHTSDGYEALTALHEGADNEWLRGLLYSGALFAKTHHDHHGTGPVYAGVPAALYGLFDEGVTADNMHAFGECGPGTCRPYRSKPIPLETAVPILEQTFGTDHVILGKTVREEALLMHEAGLAVQEFINQNPDERLGFLDQAA